MHVMFQWAAFTFLKSMPHDCLTKCCSFFLSEAFTNSLAAAVKGPVGAAIDLLTPRKLWSYSVLGVLYVSDGTGSRSVPMELAVDPMGTSQKCGEVLRMLNRSPARHGLHVT